MSDQTPQDQEKVDEYLRIIQERILTPIREIGIQQSCTATLLLLFAAVDGLGKLLHRSKKAGSNERIRVFLDYMGGDYSTRKTELLNLRHSLVHNAVNAESYLSRTETTADQHLQIMGAAGFIYVNTMTMYRAFSEAFNKFRNEIHDQPALLKQAADRLEWREDHQLIDLDPNIPSPTPPPPVEFIFAK